MDWAIGAHYWKRVQYYAKSHNPGADDSFSGRCCDKFEFEFTLSSALDFIVTPMSMTRLSANIPHTDPYWEYKAFVGTFSNLKHTRL